jgi:hypothetical protein
VSLLPSARATLVMIMMRAVSLKSRIWKRDLAVLSSMNFTMFIGYCIMRMDALRGELWTVWKSLFGTNRLRRGGFHLAMSSGSINRIFICMIIYHVNISCGILGFILLGRAVYV